MAKYAITKTSIWSPHRRPLPGARREPYVRVDYRTFRSPEAYQKRLGEDWFARGTNHRRTKSGIARDLPDKAWFIEVDDLHAFVKKHGTIVAWRSRSTTATGSSCSPVSRIFARGWRDMI